MSISEIYLELILGTAAILLLLWGIWISVSTKNTQKLAANHLQSVQREHQSDMALQQEKINNLQTQLQTLIGEKQQLQQNILTVSEQHRISELRTKELSTKLEQIPSLTDSFRNISQEVLLQQTEQMSKTGKRAVSESMKPINEQFTHFTEQLNQLKSESLKEREALKTTVSVFAKNMQEWDIGAKNLTRALTGDQVKVRGDWGELHLEQLLQKIGMKRDVDYLVQPSYSVDGQSFRPDFVIKMPNNRAIIIDSKVIIRSWLEYSENLQHNNEEENRKNLEKFLQQVNLRMQELTKRDYSNIPQLGAVDMTLMFIPIEPAYITYMQSNFSDAMVGTKIALTSPTTITPILNAIGYIWRLQKQNENSQNMASQISKLLSKLDNFLVDFDKLERQIVTVSKTFSGAKNKLTAGRGNVIEQSRKIIDMSGIETKNLKGAAKFYHETSDYSTDEDEQDPMATINPDINQ